MIPLPATTPPAPATAPPAPRRGWLRHGNPSGDFAAAPRCGARTRAGGCCRQPAMANGRCRLHGGKSTGPRSAAGRAACARARLVHGGDTSELVALRAAAAAIGARLAHLAVAARRTVAGHGLLPANRPSAPSESPPGAPDAPSPPARAGYRSHRRSEF